MTPGEQSGGRDVDAQPRIDGRCCGWGPPARPARPRVPDDPSVPLRIQHRWPDAAIPSWHRAVEVVAGHVPDPESTASAARPDRRRPLRSVRDGRRGGPRSPDR